MAQYTQMVSERIRRIAIILATAGTLGVLFYTYLHFSENNVFPPIASVGKEIFASISIGWVLGVSLYLFNHQLDRWIPWRKYFAARFLTGYISNLAIGLTLTIGLALAFIHLSGKEHFWTGLTPRDEDVIVKITILLLTSLFI